MTRARRAASARPRPDRTRASRAERWSVVSTSDVDGMSCIGHDILPIIFRRKLPDPTIEELQDLSAGLCLRQQILTYDFAEFFHQGVPCWRIAHHQTFNDLMVVASLAFYGIGRQRVWSAAKTD